MKADVEEPCVAIIGAGVSGLVSAVNMHKVGIYPTVFDQASGIGGMWNDHLKPCWQSMQTNISKFTTMLCDFPWPVDAPIFPRQHQVYAYLLSYVKHFLSDDVFQLSTEVMTITRSNDEPIRWTVQYRTSTGSVLSRQFHFVIIASGFFNTPHIPSNITGLSSFPGQILHSSDYHSIEQVRGKRVILVGASMSAAEIAADAAITANHVLHIASHNFWTVPRWIPSIPNDPTSPFLPIDLVLYRQKTRSTSNEVLFRSAEDYKRLNTYFRSITGGKQRSAEFATNNEERELWLAISNMYAPWSRSGKITLQQGRLKQIYEDGSLELDHGLTIPTSQNDVLLMCTGYRPSLPYFSNDILAELSYRPEDILCPVILHRCVFHPSLPNLAFVGMYRGTYWGISELQARWVAGIFSGRLTSPSVEVQRAGLDLERQIRNQSPRPQFPHRDYVGMANDLVRDVFGTLPSSALDIVSPIQFCSGEPNSTITDEILHLCEAAKQGCFVAGVLFRALYQTEWNFERTVTGSSNHFVARGTARFDATEQRSQLVYTERMELAFDDPFEDLRSCMYVYDEIQDTLVVHFNGRGTRSDSSRHQICILPPSSPGASSMGWHASSEYQSNEKLCTLSYFFPFHGVSLFTFEVIYNLNDSHHSYVSKTIFHSKESNPFL